MGWKEKARERVKEKREGNSFKLNEGDNCLRVMPNKKALKALAKGEEPEYAPYIEFNIHRDVGPDHRMVACGKDVDGTGECWLCDKKIPELLASKVPSKKAMADSIRRREQFLVQASRFDLDTKKFMPPKPWWVSTGGRKSLSVHIQSLLTSSRRSFDDPKKGYNINIHRTGQGLATIYDMPDPDESPTKVPSNIIDMIKDLEEFVPQYDETEQKAAYMGRPSPREEARENAATGRNGGGRDRDRDRDRRRGRAAVDEEEEEEADEQEVDDDDEETSDEEDDVADSETEEETEADEEENPEDEPDEDDDEDEAEADEDDSEADDSDDDSAVEDEPEEEPEPEPEPPPKKKKSVPVKPPVKTKAKAKSKKR